MSKIDFVIMWVDGSDPNWIREKLKYETNSDVPCEIVAHEAKNFRDWGILQYWFRGVEKFAPWVNRVFFVTYGHLPRWLDTTCPKLRIVKHEDFMPDGSLPTFNSRALELNLHRIPDLEEKFVYFNDDMFIIRPVSEDDFFQGELPCDCAILSPIIPVGYGTAAIQANDIEVINNYFNGSESIRKNKKLWFSPRYGGQIIRTLLTLPFRQFAGFYEPHIPFSYLKDTYRIIWTKEYATLLNTTMSKFRHKDNVNQWLMRYWQLADGRFAPRSPSFAQYYDLRMDILEIVDVIRQQKKAMICLNDSNKIDEMDNIRNKLIAAFESILPSKSSFEL